MERALQIVVADTGAPEERRGWLRPERRWTCPSFEVALSLTRAGIGLCAAPLSWIEADLAEGRLLRLDPSRPLTVQVHAVAPLGIATGPSARALLQCLCA